MANEFSWKTRFWVGCAGGVAPYALSFAAFLNSLTPDTLPTMFSSGARIISVLIYSVIGGLVGVIWDPSEKKLWRLFVVGLGAPAIILSLQTNLSGSGKPAGGAHRKTLVHWRGLVLYSLNGKVVISESRVIEEPMNIAFS